MESGSLTGLFVQELDKALHHLYDPGTLRRCALLRLFDLQDQADATSELQRLLTAAIAALKPADSTPPGADAWRIYHILYYRFEEQFTQREVAADLSLSTRQLRRKEKVALQVLADYLWNAYDLQGRALAFDPSAAQAAGEADVKTPSRQQELTWLERTIPSEQVGARSMVEAALDVVRPLAQAARVAVYLSACDGLPPLTVQRTSARQALLYVLTTAIHCVPDGRVDIRASARPRQVCVEVQAVAERAAPQPAGEQEAENLNMARELVQLSGGLLQAALDPESTTPFAASVVFPTAEQVPVLIIDDNTDTLQLLERYLSGSRYHPICTPDPQEALALTEQLKPDIIVLDVMLPDIDGWELLGRLREHPLTRRTPIVVCTILAQQQLAMTLGAADFLRKPVSRQAFLSALERQVALPARGRPVSQPGTGSRSAP
jgi:CheY-like chemotaxis protein